MDTDMLTALVDEHGLAVYRFCYMLARNKADADDLYQDTFLRASELRHQLSESSNPKAFLIAIAHGLWRNRLRKLARRLRIARPEPVSDERHGDFSDTTPDPEQSAIANELRRLVRAAAAKLPQHLRVPLYMHYAADMSVSEVAAALGIPAGTVKSRLHRAREILRQALEGIQDETRDGGRSGRLAKESVISGNRA